MSKCDKDGRNWQHRGAADTEDTYLLVLYTDAEYEHSYSCSSAGEHVDIVDLIAVVYVFG